MKFEVKGPSMGDFEVTDVKTADAKTRNFIARAVVMEALTLLVGGAVYAMISQDIATVRGIVCAGACMVGTVLGFCFFKER